MIITFDAYRPDTWVDVDGLTVSVPPTPEKRAMKTGLRGATRSVVFAVGLALTSLPFVTEAMAVGGQVRFDSTSNTSEAANHDVVRPGHWGALIKLVRNAGQLPADDMSGDPPSLV